MEPPNSRLSRCVAISSCRASDNEYAKRSQTFEDKKIGPPEIREAVQQETRRNFYTWMIAQSLVSERLQSLGAPRLRPRQREPSSCRADLRFSL
eukprot:s378_g37.t1